MRDAVRSRRRGFPAHFKLLGYMCTGKLCQVRHRVVCNTQFPPCPLICLLDIHLLLSIHRLKLSSRHTPRPLDHTVQGCSPLLTENGEQSPTNPAKTIARALTFPRNKSCSKHLYVFQISTFSLYPHDYLKFNAARTPEVRDYVAKQMLHLAQMSHEVYNAKLHYQRLRVKEMELIQGILQDEVEENQACVNQMECQVGEIRRHVYNIGGMEHIDITRERWSRLLDRGSSHAISASDQNSESNAPRSGLSGKYYTVPPASPPLLLVS